VTTVSRQRLTFLVMEQIELGYTTSTQITSNLNISQPRASFILNILIREGRVFREKVKGVLHYSTAQDKAPPANDPFGLCHGHITKSYATPPRIHRLDE
jgi:Mn-dependent DtxR family transcriptional regulator